MRKRSLRISSSWHIRSNHLTTLSYNQTNSKKTVFIILFSLIKPFSFYQKKVLSKKTFRLTCKNIFKKHFSEKISFFKKIPASNPILSKKPFSGINRASFFSFNKKLLFPKFVSNWFGKINIVYFTRYETHSEILS